MPKCLDPLQAVKTSFLYIKKNLHFVIFYMHAQGLSSVTPPPQKKKRKKSISNSRKFYIYNLTWKGLRKPSSFHAHKNKSQQSHSRTKYISRCCQWGGQTNEKTYWKTSWRGRKLIWAQKRRGTNSEKWMFTMRRFRGPNVPSQLLYQGLQQEYRGGDGEARN